jgi:hypothetical protein
MYFEQVGPKLEDLHQLLKKDEVLQELARQPLMLSIMTLAYQDKSTYALASENIETVEMRRNHLFDTYIEKMFGRFARTKNELYTPEQAKAWLVCLARKMIAHNQVPFFVEGIQPKWLDQSKKRIFSGLFGLISYLIAGLILALGFDLLLDRVGSHPANISSTAPIMGGFIGLVLWLNDRLHVPIIWNWKKRLFMGLICGLVLVSFPGIDGGVSYGILISLSFGWLGNLSEIRTVDMMTGSWRKAIVYGIIFAIIIGLISGFLEGIVVGLIILILYLVAHYGTTPVDQMVDQFMDQIAAQSVDPIPPQLLEFISASLLEFINSLKPESALTIGLFIWLSQALINGILVGPFIALILGRNNQQLSQTTYPGQRLVHSYRNSIRFLLSTALLAGGITLAKYFFEQYLSVMPNEVEFSMELIAPIAILAMLSIGISLMLSFALACGLIGVLRFGGIALLQHYAFRRCCPQLFTLAPHPLPRLLRRPHLPPPCRRGIYLCPPLIDGAFCGDVPRR